MKAGDLRERVTIQSQLLVPDGAGGYTETWSDIAIAPRVWANVLGLTGDEALKNLVERSTVRWRVTIRLRRDLTTKHRLVWDERVLDIKTAMPLSSDPRAFTLLICESEAE